MSPSLPHGRGRTPESQRVEWVTVNHEATGADSSVAWWSANDRLPPKAVIEVDDQLTADDALRYASQGTGMLWRGDFHGARQLLGALGRRLDARAARKTRGRGAAKSEPIDAAEFYRIRQRRAQRSHALSHLLVPVAVEVGQFAAPKTVPDVMASVPLRRAPSISRVFEFGYAAHLADARESFSAVPEKVPEKSSWFAAVSLQELTGVMSAYQWFVSGVDVPSLAAKIHPHYGTFLPTRNEYVDLVAQAPLPDEVSVAFDIGTGTGVLAAVLAKRGVARVIGTDLFQRAVDCANDNFTRLGVADVASAELCDMFPSGKADLVVCNPPWLPGSAATSLDAAIYDPSGRMLSEFLARLPQHLTAKGEGWLVISDLAELVGLRTRESLLEMIAEAGLRVVDRIDTAPQHPRASDQSDALHAARSREVTSLWRLRVA